MERKDRGYHVKVDVSLHPDEFSWMPIKRVRKLLSWLSTHYNVSEIGSHFNGMTYEEAVKIAEDMTDTEGYSTAHHPTSKFISKGNVEKNF